MRLVKNLAAYHRWPFTGHTSQYNAKIMEIIIFFHNYAALAGELIDVWGPRNKRDLRTSVDVAEPKTGNTFAPQSVNLTLCGLGYAPMNIRGSPSL